MITLLGQARRFQRGRAILMAAVLALFVSVSACSKNPRDKRTSPLHKGMAAGDILDITPVRGERGPLRLHRDGDEQKCSACHEGFRAYQGDAALSGEHKDMTFEHGLNLLCLNCHHPKNSDAYVYHDGSEIPGDESTRLCSKCHGPHFRDYTLGIHGRTNGYWDARLGEQKKLDCIQCHDPHRPKFQPIKPDPRPVLARAGIAAHGVISHGR